MRNFFLFLITFFFSINLQAANRLQVGVSSHHCSEIVALANRVLGFAIELSKREVERLSQFPDLGIQEKFTYKSPENSSTLTLYSTTADVKKFVTRGPYTNFKLAYKLPKWGMVSKLWDAISFAGSFSAAGVLAFSENKESFVMPVEAWSVVAFFAPFAVKQVKEAMLYNVNYTLNGQKITSAQKAFGDLAKERVASLSDDEHIVWVMNVENADWPF